MWKRYVVTKDSIYGWAILAQDSRIDTLVEVYSTQGCWSSWSSKCCPFLKTTIPYFSNYVFGVFVKECG